MSTPTPSVRGEAEEDLPDNHGTWRFIAKAILTGGGEER
jgi:hypothetical protein